MQTRFAIVALFSLAVTGCPKERDEPFTFAEASQALEESQLASQAVSLTSGAIEISTNFTIGQAVNQAAEELRDFISSQLPCAEITVENATLNVEYGANPGNCTYKGHTYSGSSSVGLSIGEDGTVVVEHEWTELSNNVVSVSGTATVTWSWTEKSRRVEHDLIWTRLADGHTGNGKGDRTQTTLEGGIFEGIRIDGHRSWDGPSGHWDLGIDGVEMRWVDPVPQAGSYSLRIPSGKSATLSFLRVTDNKILVTIASGNRSFEFNVVTLGSGSSTQEDG